MAINRTPIVDDDGSGMTGTILDNAWKQELYDQIDDEIGAVPPAPTLLGHEAGTATPTTNNLWSFFQFPAGYLAAFDTLLAEIELHLSPAGAWPPVRVAFWNAAGAVEVINLSAIGNPANYHNARLQMRRHAIADTAAQFLATAGGDGGPGAVLGGGLGITTWAGAGGIYISTDGVPAGKNLYWKWSVHKYAG